MAYLKNRISRLIIVAEPYVRRQNARESTNIVTTTPGTRRDLQVSVQMALRYGSLCGD